jgi:methylated-DNA-[protein]-cysteine S-methyltransferase
MALLRVRASSAPDERSEAGFSGKSPALRFFVHDFINGGRNMRYIMTTDTPFGPVWLSQEGEALVSLALPGEVAPSGEARETPLMQKAASQLKAYFEGARRDFDVPLSPVGTAFQRSVWDALTKIPAGETRSYGEIAKAIGKPKASRAVGSANHHNPLPILIPCHRVIGAGGALVGYGGGLSLKQALLDLEARYYKGQSDK